MNTSDNQKWTLNEVLTNFTKRQAQIAQEKQMKEELKQLMLNQQAQQLSQFVPGMDQVQPQEESLDQSYNAYKQGGIHIDPSKKGTFKAQATRMGMGVQEAARHILANREKYSSAMIKKANFARNFAKEEGGTINNPGFNALPEYVQEKILSNMEYGGDFEMPEYGRGGYTVRRSNDRKGKTHVVIGPDGTKKYFGDPSMGERSKSKNGKDAFYARHSSNLKNNPYFRAYARATWEEGGEMNDDPCPEGHYWNEYTRECIPFSENVPSQQQVFDTYNPMYDTYQDFLNKLERKRNVEEYELYRQEKLNKLYEKNYKGPWIIDEETGEKIRIDKASEEYQKFKESEDFKNFKNEYPSKDSPGFDIPKDFEQKQYYPKDGVWDEESKRLFNNFFNYNDEDLKNFQNYFDKTYPGEHRKASPKDIYEDNYDNWCPCYKTQQIFVQGLPVTQKVCVPCEQAKYGGVFYNEGGEMIKRADGSYSRRGLWDNIRANRGSGKKPTKEMLAQERKIKKKADGGAVDCPEGSVWIETAQRCVSFEELSEYSNISDPSRFTPESLERAVNSEVQIQQALQELELAKQQYPELEAKYTAAQEALLKEQRRVNAVRSRVIPASEALDKADNKYETYDEADLRVLEKYYKTADGKAWDKFINSRNPSELERNRQNLPQGMKDVLPNQGRYNVARWDSSHNDWKYGASPGRELYCTPYGCFAYQKAGANDVPIVGGNIAFANMSKSGQLPFEKINPSQRQPGDVGLFVDMAPSDYTTPGSSTILRPHHTTIYAGPSGNPNNYEAGKFYNAKDGYRLAFGMSTYDQSAKSDPRSRIDYYRYVGKTRELEAGLKDLENQKLAEGERLKTMESSIPMPYMPMFKASQVDLPERDMDLRYLPEPVVPPTMRERVDSAISKFIPTMPKRYDEGGQTDCPEGTTWNEQLQSCVPVDQNEAQAFLTNWYQNRSKLFDNPESANLEETEEYKAWMNKILPTIQQRTKSYPAPIYKELIENDPTVMGMYVEGKNPQVILKESLKKNPREKTITETHEYSTFLTDPMQKFVYPVHNTIIEENFKSYDELTKGKSDAEAEDIGAFYDYVTNPQQDNVHSYLMNARRIFNVKPDQVVTEDDVNNWLEKANSEGMLDKNSPNYNDELYILFNMSKGKKGLSNLFNYMVSNKSGSDNSLTMAKLGGSFGYVPNFF